MKKILFLFAAATVAFSCGQKNKANISGTFSGVNKDTVYLEFFSTGGRMVIDSTITSSQGDFKFRVKLPVAAPSFYTIHYKNSAIPLLISPGEKVKINSLCDISRNYTVEGSEESKLLKEFNTLYTDGLHRLDSLSNLYTETPSTADQEARRTQLLREYSTSYVKSKRAYIAFIVKHAASMAAVYALYQRLPNDDALFNTTDDHLYYRMVADSLVKKYPDSPHVKALLRDVKTQDDALALAQQANTQYTSGVNYPEITLSDMYGKQQKLSSLNGKAILLIFWSVDDEVSPSLNSEMKSLYKDFSDKGFTIYQVCLQGNRGNWVGAIQAQRLPWINVYDPDGFSGMAAMSYNVAATPVNILIDKNGNINGRNLRGTTLRTRITELTR